MSRCPEIRNDLVALLDGELAGAAKAALEAHLAACEACRRERDALARTGALLASYGAPEPAPGFEARVRARIAASESAERQRKILAPIVPGWRRFVVPAAVAAGLLLGAVGIAARLGFLDAAIDPDGVHRAEDGSQEPAVALEDRGRAGADDSQDAFAPDPFVRSEPEPEAAPSAAPSLAPAPGTPAAPQPPSGGRSFMEDAIARLGTQQPPPSPGQKPRATPPVPHPELVPDPELLAKLDLIQNLDILENLDLLEVYDAPEDPTQLLEEDRG